MVTVICNICEEKIGSTREPEEADFDPSEAYSIYDQHQSREHISK